MKKLIFKFFLISLFTCLSFFSIDKVYAFNYFTTEPDYLKHCSDGTCGTLQNNQFYRWNINDIKYVGYDFQSNKERLVWVFNDTSLDEGYYDFAFTLFSNQIMTDNSNNHIDASSLQAIVSVSANDVVCTVAQSSMVRSKWAMSGATHSDNFLQLHTNSMVQVTCNDVYIGGDEEYGSILRVYLNQYTDQSGEIGIADTIFYDFGIKNYYRSLEKNSNNQTKALEDINKKQEEINNSINNSDTSESSKEAGDFFSGFSTDTHGLTSIITAPLTLIGNITSSTCSPLALEVPFVEGKTLNLPCMSSIYKKHFGNFLNVYQIATFGLVAYWVCVRIFALVKDFKNPDHDEVEVMDL